MTNIRLFLMFASTLLPFAAYTADSLEDMLKGLSSSLESLEKTVRQKEGVQIIRTGQIQKEILKAKEGLKPVLPHDPVASQSSKSTTSPKEQSLEGALKGALEKRRGFLAPEYEPEGEEGDDWDTD